jgi:hypothetical protein
MSKPPSGAAKRKAKKEKEEKIRKKPKVSDFFSKEAGRMT